MSVQILAVEDNELHAENIHFCAEELGYSIINVPFGTIKQRTDYIINSLSCEL